MRFLIALLLLTLPASAADRRISVEEFEALVTGKTLSYASQGTEYGAEEYFENRRVRWSFLDGECTDGRWYVQNEQICFVYEDIPSPQCWQFFLRGGRLLARFENDPAATELYETRRRSGPLQCLGPEVGV